MAWTHECKEHTSELRETNWTPIHSFPTFVLMHLKTSQSNDLLIPDRTGVAFNQQSL